MLEFLGKAIAASLYDDSPKSSVNFSFTFGIEKSEAISHQPSQPPRHPAKIVAQ
ncbi:hypothetical protein [Crocosphaera sp. XPORK-15E]|uniref:hypothetical protein n=1 Tax=Crocosphaera sp. XPORK-15E TaxID=3110247 RepID=UPI002B21964D|nr:hypothetical protein [Crocosphaera sp. XPORK-15E]MEA5535682.1 hypothetical protein [Crocosphaera sp. XPORK-15E]